MLAVAVAAALVLAIGLAAAGAFSGNHAPVVAQTGRPSEAVSATRYGDVAWVTAQTFAHAIHPREANSWGEIKARAFIFGAFQQYGFFPRTQEFIAGHGTGRVQSANIIVVKQGSSAKQIIIGAHYDSAPAGEGYANNATGIGLLLETAARLRQVPTPYTLVFVAFGAEERGSAGSRYYARTMSSLERRATIGMIDLDGVAGGPRLVVAGRAGRPTWLRDDTLAAAQSLHVALGSQTLGLAQAPSADVAFAGAGLPTALLTSLGSPAIDGAPAWLSRNDVVARVEKAYPGRVRRQLRAMSHLLATLLTAKLETRP